MEKFQKLSIVLDQFIHMYPNDIKVFMDLHVGNTLLPDDILYCKFLCSKVGKPREVRLLKKSFPNSMTLYEKIKDDFLDDKQLTSLGYDIYTVGHGNDYMGLQMINSAEQRLSVYFSEKVLPFYEKEYDFFQQQKQHDFFEYAANPIKGGVVDKMTIRSAIDDRSGVVYVFDNYQYCSSYHKSKQLGYYYRKSQNQIDEGDLMTILELIRLFINSNLADNPHYEYKLNHKYQTMVLRIVCDSGKFIEITDSDLIDKIEKAAIIDDLWKIMHHKIDEMPKQIKIMKER